MAIQRTFSIIKPDATKRNLTGAIVAKFEEAGLRIVASKRIQLTLAQAQEFYGVHSERPFFGNRCSGSRRRRCDREKPSSYGRYKPCRRRSRHNPQRVRFVYRRKLCSRL